MILQFLHPPLGVNRGSHQLGYKYKRDGWFKRSISNVIFLIKFKFGANPYKLAKSYYKN